MLAKTITFEDFAGESITETFYFNLTKAELAKMELSQEGGMVKMLEKIVAAQDTKKIIDMFEQIISTSYGIRSDDNRRFIKNSRLAEEFMESGAYEVLFMELLTNPVAAAEFIKGIVPKDLSVGLDAETGKVTTVVPNRAERRAEARELTTHSDEKKIITEADLEGKSLPELAEIMQKVSSGELTIAK